MEGQFHGGMIIRASEGTQVDDDPDLVKFRGVISNNNLDSDFERMGTAPLRDFSRKLKMPRSIKVLGEHNSMSQPLGRSLDGRYKSKTKETVADFYIQRGLSLRSGFNAGGYASTDDYIAAIEKGTATDLSIGAIVKKETCDYCGADMKAYSFFGMRWVEDENGHWPGKKFYVDEEGEEHREPGKGLTEVLITATIKKADLKEFSIVSFGAVPGAEIQSQMQKAWADGQIEQKHLDQWNDRYAIKSGPDGLIFPITKSSRKSIVVVPKSIGGNQMDRDMERLEKQLAQEKELSEALTAERDKAIEERDAFAEKAEQYDALEAERDELVEQLEATDEEIQKAKSQLNDVSDDAWKAKQYDTLHQVAVTNTLSQFTKAKGESLREGELEKEREKLESTEDISLILKWHDYYKKQYLSSLRKARETSPSRGKADLAADEIDMRAFI